MFKRDVHAAIVGEAAHFFGDGHYAVVDDLVGTELFGFGDFFVIARGGDHSAAKEFGDLDGGAANTAAGCKDEDLFPGLKLGAIYEHVPGGLENQGNGGRVGPIEILGIGHAIDFGAADVFGAASINHAAKIGEIAAEIVVASEASGTFATSDAGGEDHFLADVDGGDVGSNLGDFASDVAAGNVGQRNLEAGEATAHPEVKMIEGAGPDTDQDFVAAERGFGNVGKTKNGWVTMFLEDDGFHERPPVSEKRWR